MNEELQPQSEALAYAFQISSADEILNAHPINNDTRMDAIEARIESAPEPKIFTWYIRFQLSRVGPYIIALWWTLVLLLGVFYGFHFLNLTVFSFSAPAGTDGYVADEKMSEQFAARINSRQILLYFKCDACGGNKADAPPIEWTPHLAHDKFLNASYDGWLMNRVSQHIVEWAQAQGGIFESYTDFYSTYFYDGVQPIIPDHPAINASLAGKPRNQMLAALAQDIFISEHNNSAIAILTFDSRYAQQDKNRFMDDLHDACRRISHEIGGDVDDEHRVTVTMTGESALIYAMNQESRKDVERKDTLTIPIALCVLAFVIRSWRLMFIPLITFAVSICASFSVMRPFAEHVLDVNPFCPSIMMSVTIAMSIDYSLFLLSRYREEVERHGHKHHGGGDDRARMIAISRDAVRQSTRWSGKVIALSGCILSLTYFALIFYPMQVLQSVGLGAGLAIVCTILVNLTLTPALLLMFPYFCSQFGCAGCRSCSCSSSSSSSSCRKCCGCCEDVSEPLMVNGDNNNEDDDDDDERSLPEILDGRHEEPLQSEDVSAAAAHSHSHSHPRRYDKNLRVNDVYVAEVEEAEATAAAVDPNDGVCERCWFMCASKTTVCPWSILIVVLVYAVISPFAWQFTTFEQQLADTLVFPRDSPYYATYQNVVRDFSAGLIAPWYILIFKKQKQATLSPRIWNDYINETGALMAEVFERVQQDSTYNISIQGMGFFGSIGGDNNNKNSLLVTHDVWRDNITCFDAANPAACYIKYAADPTQCYNCSQLNGTYQYVIRDKISDDGTASFYEMHTQFDPYYEDAIAFVSDFRSWLQSACARWDYDCFFTGGSVDEVDSVQTIYANFPTVLCAIVSFVFCIMGVVFKSLFVPFRLFVTIAIPMTFVYGVAVMTYQHGLLSHLHVEAFADTDGLYWLIPVMTVTILIGLALDYDIFLFARIYEYRVMGGVDTREAIVRGVYKTGSIITAAGIIMGIAFCGLLMSKITSLNQTGFIMVIAVLVDTFIIRTSLVPAVLSIAKEVNWWPGLNPKCQRQLQEQPPDFPFDVNNSHGSRAKFSVNSTESLDETM